MTMLAQVTMTIIVIIEVIGLVPLSTGPGICDLMTSDSLGCSSRTMAAGVPCMQQYGELTSSHCDLGHSCEPDFDRDLINTL